MKPDEIRMDRRGLLKVGMLGSVGLCLADVMRLQAAVVAVGLRRET